MACVMALIRASPLQAILPLPVLCSWFSFPPFPDRRGKFAENMRLEVPWREGDGVEETHAHSFSTRRISSAAFELF